MKYAETIVHKFEEHLSIDKLKFQYFSINKITALLFGKVLNLSSSQRHICEIIVKGSMIELDYYHQV